jgi:hypothetical protein
MEIEINLSRIGSLKRYNFGKILIVFYFPPIILNRDLKISGGFFVGGGMCLY